MRINLKASALIACIIFGGIFYEKITTIGCRAGYTLCKNLLVPIERASSKCLINTEVCIYGIPNINSDNCDGGISLHLGSSYHGEQAFSDAMSSVYYAKKINNHYKACALEEK